MTNTDTPPRRLETLGFALLFSVPIGVGVMSAILMTTHGHPLDPLPLGAGLLAGVVVFALVVVGAAESGE